MMKIDISSICIFILVLMCALHANSAGLPPPNSIVMKMMNQAGAPLEVFWISPDDKSLVTQTPKALRNGTEASINSFEGHEFIARFQKHIEGVETTWFKLGREEKVVISFDQRTNQLSNKQVTKLNEVKEIISSASVECNNFEGDDFTNCVTNQVMAEMNRITDGKSEVKKYRDIIANRLVSYICSDPFANLTKPMETTTLKLDSKNYRQEKFVDLPESKVFLIRNFITTQQCEHIQKNMSPFKSQTIVGSDGVSELSSLGDAESSNLFKSRYLLDDEFPDEDKILPVLTSIYSVVNTVSEMSLDFAGQESLEVHSFKEGAHYSPHCSGECSGSPFKPGGRVATVIMQCKVPEAGGLLAFPKSDVLLQPPRGSAVFVLYKDAAGHTDEGYTEHMSCPVSEGNKVTAVLHLRDGVTTDNPWYRFSSTGTPL